MKNLKILKFIFTFVFLLFHKILALNFCSETSCTISDGTSTNSYSVQKELYSGSNVRPKYIQDSSTGSIECHRCSGISQNSIYTIDINGRCLVGHCEEGGKILDKTNECTSLVLNNLFLLGDVYYCQQPSNTNCENKKCVCKSYYFTEYLLGEKKRYTCLDTIPDSTTGYKYYNYKTNEFYLNKCPDDYRYMKLKYDASRTITRCSDSCEDSEFVISVNTNLHSDDYCVNNCLDIAHLPDIDSSLTKYKYEYINDGNRKCLEKCPSGTFIKTVTIIDPNSNPNANVDKFVCVPPEQCNFYVANTDSCLSECDQNSNYKYHKYGSNECLETCPLEEYKYEREFICYKIDDCPFVSEANSQKECLLACADITHYHEHDSKFCLEQCSTNNRYHAENQYVCYSSCIDIPGDYKYEEMDEEQNSNDQNPKICYHERPTSSCEAYIKKSDGVMKCMSKSTCIDKNLKYFIDLECKNNCNGFYQIELTEGSYNYIRCFETLEDALNNGNVQFCDKSQKKCWKDFPSDDIYYNNSIFENHNTKYELVKQCTNFYYARTGFSLSSLNTNWCTDNCKNIENTQPKFFYGDNKNCLNSCKDIHKYYYDKDNNQCLDSCEDRPEKRFHYQIRYPDSSDANPVECLDKCDGGEVSTRGYHYNYDSFICILNCNDDNSGYIYTKYSENNNDESTFICYPSCKTIPGGSYQYGTKDFKCTIEKPSTDCDYYYSKEDGMYQCATAADCKRLGYLFLDDNECKMSCDEGSYKLSISLPINDDRNIFQTFQKCFASPFECMNGLTKIYYLMDLKICMKEYNENDNYFIKSVDLERYELVEECDNYYYIKNEDGKNVKYCTDKCYTPGTSTNLNMYFITGNKKCESSCSSFSKYYYDPETHECFDSCIDRDLKFAQPLVNSQPQQCILKCPNYFVTKTIDNTDILIKECVNNCPSDSSHNFLDIKTKECLVSCDPDDYFIEDASKVCYPKCNVGAGEIYIDTDTYVCSDHCPAALQNKVKLGTIDSKDIYICKSLCEGNTKFRLGNECLEKCPMEHNYIGFNNICQEKYTQDQNGQYYYQINEFNGGEYPIYKYISSCDDAQVEDSNGNIKNYIFYEQSEPNK